ncbi:MAG TPA: coproporphyrinogen III oxidase, partial [Planctomycetaceae bacterium]|nr:coproporphyrinogen III oxidase [Planctomycetaceae bacterium]
YWKSLQSGVLELTDEEVERNMYEHAIDHLAGVGFEHYEVSNFARPGFRCRHNQVYWTGKAFHAFGPGAARFVNGVREVNHRSTTKYLNDVLAGKSAVGEREELSPIDRARERLVFGLRRLEGVCIETLEEEVGFTLSEICGSEIDQLESRGLLQNQAGHIKLTRSGLLVSDSIWPRILVPNDG